MRGGLRRFLRCLRERLSAYEFFVAGREGFWPVDGAGGAYFEYQQTMVRDPANGKWRVDVMRCPPYATEHPAGWAIRRVGETLRGDATLRERASFCPSVHTWTWL